MHFVFVGGRVEAVATGNVAGRKAVDFENLAFAQGNHLMTNKKCDLPQKSYRTAQKVSHKSETPVAQLIPMYVLMLCIMWLWQ